MDVPRIFHKDKVLFLFGRFSWRGGQRSGRRRGQASLNILAIGRKDFLRFKGFFLLDVDIKRIGLHAEETRLVLGQAQVEGGDGLAVELVHHVALHFVTRTHFGHCWFETN